MAMFKDGDKVVIAAKCDHGDKPCSYPSRWQGKVGVIHGEVETAGSFLYYNVTMPDYHSTQAYEYEISLSTPVMTDEEIEAFYIENFIEA